MRFFEASEVSMGRDETTLHSHRFLMRAGLAIGNLFAWVFVFEYFLILSGSIPRALIGVLVMYGISQLVTILLTPIAAANLRKGGKRTLIWAVVVAGSAYVMLGATLGGFFHEPLLIGVALFAVLLGAYRALYFAPYELSRVEADKTSLRGRIFWEVLLALLPALVGATLVMEPYASLRILFGAAALIGISALPLAMLQNVRERFSFSFVETYRELFADYNRPLATRAFLDGMQGAALFLVWPLVIFLIVGFSYATLGIVFSITLLAVLISRSLYRRLPFSRELSTPVLVVLAISGWIARLAAGTPVGIIVADVYAYTTHGGRGTLVDPFVFEQAADNGSFVDEYTVLKEIALAGGRIVFVFIVGALIFSTSLIVAFGAALVLAALAAGTSVFLAKRHRTS